MTDVYKNSIIKLSLLDSIHDFWKKRNNKTISNDEDGIDNEDLNNVRDDLTQRLSSYLETNKDISVILYKLTSDNSISPVTNATSTFELNVQSYFETHPEYSKYFYDETKQRVSYQEIIRGTLDIINDNKILENNTTADVVIQLLKKHFKEVREFWSEYINGIDVKRTLIIFDDGSDDLDFKVMLYIDGYKVLINTFILAYMKGEFNVNLLELISPQLYLTFDASGKYIKKLFISDERFHNMITPQNISDSATTSFNQLKDRIHFEFPTNNSSGSFNITTDVFNKKNLLGNMHFNNNGFDDKNRFGFSIDIKSGIKKGIIEFNSFQKDGPSVNYLASIISNIKNQSEGNFDASKIIRKNSNVDVFNTLKDITGSNDVNKNGILYDLKRIGDYEQCNAAKSINDNDKYKGSVVLVTLDRLCSLYSRIIQQPCIFHNNREITLYRQPTDVNEVAIQNSVYYYKCVEIFNVYNSARWIKDVSNNLNEIFNVLSPKIMDMYSDSDDKYFDIIKKKSSEYESKSRGIINDIYTIKILLILNNVMKYITDINYIFLTHKDFFDTNNDDNNKKLEKQIDIYNSFKNKAFEEGDIERYNKLIIPNIVYINDLYDTVKSFKNNEFSSLESIKENLGIIIDKNGNANDIISSNDLNMIVSDNIITRGSNSNLKINFSSFKLTYESLYKVYRLVNNQRSIDRLKRNKTTLYDAISSTNYYNEVNNITQYEGKYDILIDDKPIIKNITEILFIGDDTDDNIISKFNTITADINNVKTNLFKIVISYINRVSQDDASTIISSQESQDSRSTALLSQKSPFNGDDNIDIDFIQRQNSDFGEILFSISSMCSEVHYSLFSQFKNKYHDDSYNVITYISTFAYILNKSTDDDNILFESIDNLYNNCSLTIENELFDISQYDYNNGDPYTYKQSGIYDMVLQLFLINVNIDKTKLIIEPRLYVDNKLILDAERRQFKNQQSTYDIINKLFLENVSVINSEKRIMLVKFIVTFLFSLLYDLSSKTLINKSLFLNEMFIGGFSDDMNKYYSKDYSTGASISLLHNRLYLLTSYIVYILRKGDKIPNSLKYLITDMAGGNKKNKTIRKKGRKKHKKTIRNNHKSK